MGLYYFEFEFDFFGKATVTRPHRPFAAMAAVTGVAEASSLAETDPGFDNGSGGRGACAHRGGARFLYLTVAACVLVRV